MATMKLLNRNSSKRLVGEGAQIVGEGRAVGSQVIGWRVSSASVLSEVNRIHRVGKMPFTITIRAAMRSQSQWPYHGSSLSPLRRRIR